MKEINKKKIMIILICFCISIAIIFFIYNEIQTSKEVNNIIAYIEDYNYEQFEKKLMYSKNSTIKEKCCNKFLQFIEKELNEIKNGKKNEKLEDMLAVAQNSHIDSFLNSYDEERLKDYIQLTLDYNNFCDIQSEIDNQQYEKAFEDLEHFSKRNADDEITRKAKKMQEDIQSKAIDEVNKKVEEIVSNGKKKYEIYKEMSELSSNYDSDVLNNTIKNRKQEIKNEAVNEAIEDAQNEYANNNYDKAITILANFSRDNIKEIEECRANMEDKKARKDYEIYCYFNMIAWKYKNLTDSQAFSKCAENFGITEEQAITSYSNIESKGGWFYQDRYPDIFNKYASQY